ncbi:MAG TPA: hypothetical protein EYP87_04305 [Flavobacteriaceae bacterium]|nr:hypothetical protein [Flavobacteriaceae bacterium]
MFYEENITVTSGLDTGYFDTITRAEEKKQTTYKGCPLYYFANDNALQNLIIL